MKLLYTIQLFLLLTGVNISLSENACSQLPDVPHASVSEETKKAQYQEGDLIQLQCEPGYTSVQVSKYVCTQGGWLAVRQGICYSCSTLPDVPHAYISDETRKAEYQEGDMIRFTCETGYTTSLTITYVCSTGGWLAVGQGACLWSASGCDPPPVSEGLIIKGLPANNGPILPDHVLTFSCDGDEKHLHGSSVLVCGEDGTWNNDVPFCKVKACEVGEMHPYLFVAGLSPSNAPLKVGHKLLFNCGNDYELDGSSEIECVHPGEWNASFPTCSEKCKVTEVPDTVSINTYVPGSRLRKGETLMFACRLRGLFIRGHETVTCLGNGRWSDAFPTCGDPSACGKPPYLQDGDTKAAVQLIYQHRQRVEYTCQRFYTMQGQPYMTCNNGEWVGEMKCLRLCTVDRAALNARNLQFRYAREDKLYIPHGDFVTLACTSGTSDGRRMIRQMCNNGVIDLPDCV